MSKSGGVDELEALSNTDLRARCIEYGLPNIPITDTSRKLLVRRLRAAIDSGAPKPAVTAPAAAKANKSRRETINVVTKVIETEVEASPKKGRSVNSRRTIASEPVAVEKPPTVEVTVSSSSIPQRRRSGRMTPNPPQAEPVISSTVKRKAAIIEESDEDDTDDVQIIENNRPQIARASRSPSLAKSKTVTTSYQHYQEEEPIHEEPIYTPRETIIPVRIESSYQSSSSSSRPTITTTYERESSSYLPRPSAVQLSRPSLASSGNNAAYATQHATASSTTRRYTTSGYKPPTPSYSSNLGYRTQVNEYLHNAENSDENAEEDDEDDEEESNLDAPYLSDFARRLSRLKAEPLIDISGSLKREGSQLRDSQQRFYTTSIGGRRGISKRDSLGDSFRQFWVAIDRKYGLRKYLAVVAITLVVLFVYIFFFQQN